MTIFTPARYRNPDLPIEHTYLIAHQICYGEFYLRTRQGKHEFVKRVHARYFDRQLAEIHAEWLQQNGQPVEVVRLLDYSLLKVSGSNPPESSPNAVEIKTIGAKNETEKAAGL